MSDPLNDFQKAIHFYNEGLKLFERGDLESAIESYKNSISFDPTDPDVYNNLGVAYLRLDKLNEAIEVFKTSIDLDPVYARTYNNLGTCFFKKNVIDLARDNFEKAVECDETYIAPYLNLSEVYKIKGMVNVSIEMYMKALSLSSKNRKNTSENYGVAFLENSSKSFNHIFGLTDYDLLTTEKWERTELSIEDILNTYKTLHEEGEDTSISNFNIGVELFKKGQYEESIEYFKKSLELDQTYYPAYYNLALAYEMSLEIAEASKWYQKAIKLTPTLAAFLSLAVMQFRLGNYSQAMYNIEKAKTLAEGDPESYNNIGHALYKISKTPEAIEFYKKAIQVDPNYSIAYYNLGVVYSKIGETEDAIKSYEKVIEIEPDNVPALNNLGVAHESLRNYDKAIEYYQKTLEVNPKYSIAYENLFELLKRKEELDKNKKG